MKMKNTPHKYNINRPRLRYWQKYGKYKECLIMMILINIKVGLGNI